MPKGELYINNSDAYERWGVSLEDTAISTLMTPPSTKDFVESESRLEHGKKMEINSPRLAARDLTLNMHICASSKELFYVLYDNFCRELAKGALALWTAYQPLVEYHCVYGSCTQYSSVAGGMAVFALKLTEPNPADRTVTVNVSATQKGGNQ